MDDYFVDWENGDYKFKNIDEVKNEISGFEEIPVDEIGRK